MQRIGSLLGGCITDSGGYVRKVIPPCTVKEIEAYPDADDNYTGFRTADESYSEVDLSWIQEIV